VVQYAARKPGGKSKPLDICVGQRAACPFAGVPVLTKKIILTRGCEVSPDVRVEKIAETLSSMGHSISVLAWNRGDKLPGQESGSFGQIRRFRIRAGYGSGVKLLPKMLWFWIILFANLLKERFDAVHACDFDTLPPSLLAAKLKGRKLVYDIFDFYAEGGSIPRTLRPAIRFAEKLLMRLADSVIVVDEVRLPYLPEGVRARTVIVYNSPPDMLGRLQVASFPRVPAKNSKFRVVLSGQLIEGRYIPEMTEAVSRSDETEMIIAGFGPKEFVEKLIVKASGYGNVSYIGKNSSLEESLALVSTADAIFSLNDPAIPNNKMMSSNKLFEAMMLGKPIVVNRGTSMEEKVRRFNCGLVAENAEPESLTSALRFLRENPGMARQMGENGRRAYESFYDWRFMSERLAKLYQ
jgi:glycosyltransferase involved in cell wall biosynthesis